MDHGMIYGAKIIPFVWPKDQFDLATNLFLYVFLVYKDI